MALSLFTDFSDYELGNIQSQGWTARYVTSSLTSHIVADAGATGGQLLQFSRSGSNRKALTWDAFSADPDRADFEVAVRMRPLTSPGSGSIRCGATGRVTGGTGSESAYVGFLGAAGNTRSINEYTSGSSAALASENLPVSPQIGDWFCIRFRVETDGSDSTLRHKLWLGDAGDEPGGWDLEYLDTSPSSIGEIGIFDFYGGCEVDWIGAATGGGPAPTGSGGGDPEPVLITSSDMISCAALSASSVGGSLARSDIARLRSVGASSAAAQVDGSDAARVGGIDALQGVTAAISGSETLAVRVVESLPMVAVMIARADEIGAAATEDAGVVLVRVDRTDAIALSAPTVAQVMARLDATDDLSLSLAEASRLIGELVQIASSDVLGVGASEDADTSIHARAEDWLRPALAELLGDVFAALSAGDQTALGVVEAADVAAALRSGDTLSVMVDESEPVVTVIIEVSDSIALRVSASGVVDVITSATGRLIGVVRVVEALGGDVKVGPALGGSARLNPEDD